LKLYKSRSFIVVVVVVVAAAAAAAVVHVDEMRLSHDCCHQRAYCSPPGDMSIDNYGGMIFTG
jgi:hypothetical protein